MRVMIDDVNVSLSDRPADSPELMEGEETRPRQLCNSWMPEAFGKHRDHESWSMV